MFNSVLHRKRFSLRKNATKRWEQAVAGADEKQQKAKSKPAKGKSGEPLSVVINKTSMNEDQQKQAVDIANIALDTCSIESDIATFIKLRMDEQTGQTWHVIVGRNFGSHVSWEQYIQLNEHTYNDANWED